MAAVSAAPASAGIVQAVVAVHVGHKKCIVLAYCKTFSPAKTSITQGLLRTLEGVSNKPRTMAMGNTGCFLHIMGGNGAHALCLTTTKRNLPATFAYLDWILHKFYKGKPGNQGQFKDIGPDKGAKMNGGMKKFMDKYNGPNVMKTEAMKHQLDKITENLNDTIVQLTVRGDKLNGLLKASEDLAKRSKEVENAGRKVYWMQWYRVMKWTLLIICIVITLIVLLVLGLCFSSIGCGL